MAGRALSRRDIIEGMSLATVAGVGHGIGMGVARRT